MKNALLAALLLAPLAFAQDVELLAGMKARSIGPAGMSGRVASIDAVVSDPNVIYVGAATGGVWKSVNGGLTFKPVFDDQPVAAVGAVAIYQRNPEIVWVGTGEGNPRNSASVGNGVYRSIDGGDTWTHLGLRNTERIHRIVLHPEDPDVAYVAALGTSWGENHQRGVFKTVDGGKTWQKILYVDEKTGAADLVMDPQRPDKLVAAMWDHRRWPWFFRSGGPGSGIHVTRDGGKTWKRLTRKDGLPAGDLGRIGLAIAPSDPDTVYALVEAKKSVLLRSDDGGSTFQTVNRESSVASRPFYYADLRVDPARPHRVYNLGSLVTVSDDGGKSFKTLIPWASAHPDHHAMWIHPKNADHIIDGNDGGVYFSRDRGKTWRFVSNLPLAQFYHVAVDLDTPYHVYGGLQDNGSWRGPSTVWENGGIRNHHWAEVAFGDGFDTLPDPKDSLQGYAMSQQGYLMRWDLRTGERKNIRPAPPKGTRLRFSWNAGIAIDPFDPKTVYFGSQFVHRSKDRGETWETISGDLTTNNPEWQKQDESGGLTPDVTGAENFCTILAIAPSPVKQGVIWVGTDDGRLHVTRDGGKSWKSIEENILGVPKNTWIPHIEASKFAADAAFVVFDDHRRSNGKPYAFRVSDFGATWTDLAQTNVRGYALCIEQDPVEKDLLFMGTEFGLWVSRDGGQHWLRWTHGFPTCSAMDLVVHPREHDLVVGTHGRAVFVLDDIRPLRTVTDEILKKPLHLFAIPDAQQYRVRQTGASRFPGHTEFRGTNRPYGALLTFSAGDADLPHPKDEEADDEKKIEIRVKDAKGEVIRTFKQPVRRGVNRVTWNLRRDGFRRPSRGNRPRRGGPPQGPEVIPGDFTVELQLGDHKVEGPVQVLADPRFDIPRADREEKRRAEMAAGRLQEVATKAIERIRKTRADVDVVLGKAENNGHEALKKAGRELKKKLDGLERKFWTPPNTKGIPARTHVMSRIGQASGALGSSWTAPTAAQLGYLARAEEQLTETLAEFNKLFAVEVAAFKTSARKSGVGLFAEIGPLEIEKGGQ